MDAVVELSCLKFNKTSGPDLINTHVLSVGIVPLLVLPFQLQVHSPIEDVLWVITLLSLDT